MPRMYIGPRCDECDRPSPGAEENDLGEIYCDDCLTNRSERAWERFCDDFHDGGSTQFRSLTHQQIAARKLK